MPARTRHRCRPSQRQAARRIDRGTAVGAVDNGIRALQHDNGPAFRGGGRRPVELCPVAPNSRPKLALWGS